MTTAATTPEPAGDPAPTPARRFPIVGVGASAGGLEALQRLFEGAPVDGGLAYVVVQHLSPDFKSLMEELLARHTRLPIRRVTDGMEVQPDVVHLLPPNADMIISGGRLCLSARDPEARTLPIDLFLRSLAQDVGERAIAVILSGTGSDGSRGVRAVHDVGGLVVVQDERTAKFDGMPRSAIDTGVVDLVLSPDAIGPALVRRARTGEAPDPAMCEGPLQGDASDAMTPALHLLRRAYSIDFSLYKPSTVARRVQRRLELCGIADIGAYVERLARDPLELDALYRDLLIGVTRFFRDPEAWAQVSASARGLIERLEQDEELRCWVAGCANGAEAYTLAIVCLEAMRAMDRPPRLRVFATDAHRASLDEASLGVYSAEALAGLSPELRDRYFQPHGLDFVARADLRAHIVFAGHDVLRDAPFTRLDLISCRNLLIYFQPQAQRKTLSLFHFALRAGGLLLLGPSETPGELQDEFQPLDDRWRLYRKRRDVRLPGDLRLSIPEESQARRTPPGPHEQLVADVRDLLVHEFAPATLIVDPRGELVEAMNGASAYLSPRDGRASSSVLDLIHRDLKLAVAHGLRRAHERAEPATIGNVRAIVQGAERALQVAVHPVKRADRVECTAVTIRPEAPAPPPLSFDTTDDVARMARERIDALEQELRKTKEDLQATIEELETSNEELQATNEELIASNEELQSTNEELHSVNEELYTVNAECQLKIAQLTELTSDMENLLASTDVHTLFLDRELRLRKFTPKVAQTFNLLPQDLGRPIHAFTHTLDYPGLVADLERALSSGARIEREVRDRAGRELLVRLLPYQGRERLDGVVVTLIDVTQLKGAQRGMQETAELYRTLVRAVASVVWTSDAELRFVQPQQEWASSTGQSERAYVGRGWLDAVHPDDQARVRGVMDDAVSRREPFEARCRVWSGERDAHRHVSLRAAPVLDAAGAIVQWVGTLSDVHDEAIAEQERRRLERQLEGILAHSPAFIYVKDLQGRYLIANPQRAAYLGVAREEDALGRTDLDLLPPEVADRIRGVDRQIALRGGVHELEEQLPGPDGPRTWLSIKFALPDDEGRVVAVAGISTDISERTRVAERDRHAVERRDQFLAMLSHELRNPLAAVLTATYALSRPEVSAAARARAPEVIRRQVEHMGRLLDDLLDVSRLTRDRIEIRREVMDLSTLVREAVELVRDRFQSAGVALEVDAPADAVWVEGDAVRLQQVTTNLLSNAVKYTGAGGRARLTLSTEGDVATLRVKDTGIGIDPANLERVFELFYQEDRTLDRTRGGLGVGLTLVRELVQLHGGRVTAHSAGRDQGTEVVVTLPLAAARAVEAERADAADGRVRIVVIEDLADSRELIAMLLRDAGHVVETAPDGERGLAAVEALRPHVAFVDIGLPRLDGYEVARRIRAAAHGRAIHLVALTGYGRREDRQAAFEAGFDEHLVKPLGPMQIFSIIDRVRSRA